MPAATLVYVLLVVFLATLIRSSFGFGEALIAVPLLALRIPVQVAAPLAVMISVTVALVIVAQDWRKIHIHSAKWLLIATLFGTPLGLLFLKRVDEKWIKCVLGSIIFLFAVYALIWRSRLHLRDDHRSWLLGCGFLAGVLGAAYGMNGPPLVAYGAMRRWSAQHFRATLQGYFLPASLIGLIGYLLTGFWTASVTRYYLLSLPGTVIAILLGRAINARMVGEGFLRYVYLLLAVIGVVLLVQALR